MSENDCPVCGLPLATHTRNCLAEMGVPPVTILNENEKGEYAKWAVGLLPEGYTEDLEVSRSGDGVWVARPGDVDLSHFPHAALLEIERLRNLKDAALATAKNALKAAEGISALRAENERLSKELRGALRQSLLNAQCADDRLNAMRDLNDQLNAAQERAERREKVVEAAKAESLARRAMRAAEENEHDVEWLLRDEHEDRVRDLDAALDSLKDGAE